MLPLAKIKKGTRIIMRVDWNVPVEHGGAKMSEKILREIPFIKSVRERGAILLLLTHLGRPEGREGKFSTRSLATVARVASKLPIAYLDIDLSTADGAKRFLKDLAGAKPGEIFLGENVRFQPGEDENAPSLVKRYAAWGQVFINDAFASCHRSHASVVGLARVLPSYAGPNLGEEVRALSSLLKPSKRPYLAFIGGSKLSTKLPVIQHLLRVADRVYIGGAMAHVFFAAKRLPIGSSLIEKDGVRIAKKLLASTKKIVIPTDVIVAKAITARCKARRADLAEIKETESIGDIGTKTIQSWVADIQKAKTIIWNGPMGVTEIPAFSHASLVLAKAIALRSQKGAYTVVGGGDTLPVIAKTGMEDLFTHVSTGGGAMLEFLSENGMLPGVKVLMSR